MNVRSPHARGGFTLIEMIISAGLMSIVLTSAYFCLSAGVQGQRLIEKRGDAIQSARVALNLISADLRSAIPLNQTIEFLGLSRAGESGAADNLDFATRNYTPRGPREPDYCETSYFLTPDKTGPGYILMRRRDATPDPEPLEGGLREEIARGILGLRFEYYDGIEWFDDWGDLDGKYQGMTYPPSNSYGIPEAVRITITLDPEAPFKSKDATATAPGETEEAKAPMTFQAIARIELAPIFNRQAVSQNNDTPDPGGAQMQTEGVPQ